MEVNGNDYQQRKASILNNLQKQRERLKKDVWHFFLLAGLIWLAFFATEMLLFAIVGVVVLIALLYSLFTELPKNARHIKQIKENKNVDEIEAEINKDIKLQKELEEQRAEIDAKAKARKEAQHAYDHPECPMCKSHNTRRISTTNRAVSVAMVGLASSKIGKQYECFNCKHKW